MLGTGQSPSLRAASPILHTRDTRRRTHLHHAAEICQTDSRSTPWIAHPSAWKCSTSMPPSPLVHGQNHVLASLMLSDVLQHHTPYGNIEHHRLRFGEFELRTETGPRRSR